VVVRYGPRGRTWACGCLLSQGPRQRSANCAADISLSFGALTAPYRMLVGGVAPGPVRAALLWNLGDVLGRVNAQIARLERLVR
jgi:hypothetical protein